MKKLIIFCIMCSFITPSNAQLLKKLKDKVNKTVENATGTGGKSSNEDGNKNSAGNESAGNNNPGGNNPGGNKNSGNDIGGNPDNYSLTYSSPVNFRIMYDESRLGIRRNKSDYRLILKQSKDNKPQYVIIDNGNITFTGDSLSDDQIIGGIHEALDGLNGGNKMKTDKYLVPDTTRINIQGQASKTITAPKQIDANQAARGFEMMKKTDEYKKMSAEDKKLLEETMNQMPEAAKQYNSSELAGKTITIPGVKAGTKSFATGSYHIIIKGKNYGSGSGDPILYVSDDEANIYMVVNDKGKYYFIANDKRIPLSADAPMGHSGNLIVSPDEQKAVFIEMKNLTEKQFEDRNKSVENGGKFTMPYIVTRSDGSSFQIVRTDGGDKYRLTNSGALVYVDRDTREVFSDGKPIAKFTGTADGGIIADGLIVGNDPSKICYYMDDGSLTYLDGSQKKMGIIFPQIITDNGKTYLTWFKKLKNDIYIGKFEF
ncbi:MAG: hypothetical protein ABI204_04390 [Ginsengibacter sp.]